MFERSLRIHVYWRTTCTHRTCGQIRPFLFNHSGYCTLIPGTNDPTHNWYVICTWYDIPIWYLHKNVCRTSRSTSTVKTQSMLYRRNPVANPRPWGTTCTVLRVQYKLKRNRLRTLNFELYMSSILPWKWYCSMYEVQSALSPTRFTGPSPLSVVARAG